MDDYAKWNLRCWRILFVDVVMSSYKLAVLNHLRARTHKRKHQATSEDPDKMPHYAAFYQALHCLLRQNRSSEKEIHLFEITTFDPSIYTTDRPDLTVSNLMENSVGLKRVKQ